MYDKYDIKYMMDRCINCKNYEWIDEHICNDNFSHSKIGKHEIYFETIEFCIIYRGFKQK